jgi:hypothetical protein
MRMPAYLIDRHSAPEQFSHDEFALPQVFDEVEVRRETNARVEQQARRTEAEAICIDRERPLLPTPLTPPTKDLATLVQLCSTAEIGFRQQMHTFEERCLTMDLRVERLRLRLQAVCTRPMSSHTSAHSIGTT